MTNTMTMNMHTVDATGQSVGRLASRIALILRGKHKATFDPRIDAGDRVTVMNAGHVVFTGRKLVQKDYYHHTMYPGGIKRTPMKWVFEKDPGDVIRRAVYGMLPKNNRRVALMKRLTIVK